VADRERLSPAQEVADRLYELSTDTRAAVVLDGEGELAGSSGTERGPELADLARELVEAMDGVARNGPPEQLEAQVVGGSVYVVRRPEWTLAAVARRSALSSLIFYDARAVLSELEGSWP
jgi:hypothetical protein